MNVIQISGGLDSMALLFLLKPLWGSAAVMWVDTGAAYPETHKLMERIATMLPNFVRVNGNQPKIIEHLGYPVDVVPVKFTKVGHLAFKPQAAMYQSYMECCARSIWIPAMNVCRQLGASVVYRGQRNGEKRTAPVKSGEVQDGIAYMFPLEDWTKEQVREYCDKECPDFVPSYYDAGELTSRDCWDCTAYRDENVQRVKNLPYEKRLMVEARLEQWREHVTEEMAYG